MKIQIKKLPHYDKNYDIPQYETSGAAGADIRAMLKDKKPLVIGPNQRCLVPTGMAFAIEKGYEVQIRPRSGLSLKSSLLVVNSPGTVDCDYRGEVCIIMGNFSNKEVVINHGDRIAQMVTQKVIQAEMEVVDELDDTERGSGGFGSTGNS